MTEVPDRNDLARQLADLRDEMTSLRKELEDAEGKVEILLKQNGKLQAEVFEPEKAGRK